MNSVDVSKRHVGINKAAGSWEVILWAPLCKKAELVLPDKNKRIALEKDELGNWKKSLSDLEEGDRYFFRLDEEKQLPDPASLSQPEGVHEASRVVDLNSFQFKDENWKNHSLHSYIIYELHCGCFTREGTFSALANRLDHLLELGVNAIEIMPVAQFPGERNWGYDGVFPFAVQHSYGGAKGLMHLIDQCHAKGIAIILDVVYNHMGPEGNYLGAYGPYFTDKYKTPWGAAINFDDEWSDGVRSFFIENVLMWFRDFHVDALRLDAVHAIKDLSAVHILKEIRDHVDELESITGRKYHLIVESDLNDPRYINKRETGGYGMDAQWVDEFHHALRVSAGEKPVGYYSDFEGLDHLAKAFNDAYVYDGQYSKHRKRRFGIKTTNSGDQFIVFSQNHDQVGNRMLGERTSSLVTGEMIKVLAAAVILSPFIPMLFMGEEWGETNPFLYFVSHTDQDLAEAVRKGRTQEFASFFSEGEAPDPTLEETFIRSKLDWKKLSTREHAAIFNYYKELLRLRKQYAAFNVPDRDGTHAIVLEKQILQVTRRSKDQIAVCFYNFSKQAQSISLPVGEWQLVLNSSNEKSSSADLIGPDQFLSPESVKVYMHV